MERIATDTIARISVGQFSDKGLKERNDDSYGVVIPEPPLLITKGIAMAIADGMSTSEAAKEASESCVKSFLTDYYATHDSWTVQTSVARVLTATNRWLYGQGQTQYLSDRGMVSTFSGLVLKASVGYIFHAGDSRISLLRDGQVEPLTTDHRIRLSRSEEVLSRAFGIDPELEVDFRSLQLQQGDFLIFTTDGVHDFVTSQDIISAIEIAGDELNGVAKSLCELAMKNCSTDNVTCQIVRIDHCGTDDPSERQKHLSSLPFPPDLEVGQIFEGYRVLKLLHASNKTQIYLAAIEASGERVVLKTPSVNFDDDPLYIEHFTREEWIGRSLNSPHVVRVIEPAEQRRHLYYTTEYIEGITLRQWMEEHPAPTLNEVRDIITQIAKGLRAFHRKEMVHQDLKPDNIMIDKYGVVKLVDFGSTWVAGLEEISRADDLQMRGTVDYTAPEYHLGTRPGNRADIYSLGVLAYEMLTGKLPFGKGFATKAQVGKLKHVPAHHVRDDLPYWLSLTLRQAVRRDPGSRYQTLSEFEQDLLVPNPKFMNEQMVPLLERNPIRFWQMTSFGLFIVNLVLVYILLTNG